MTTTIITLVSRLVDLLREDLLIDMEVQSNENNLNMEIDSNENTMEIEVLDRPNRRENPFNKFQHDRKEEGIGKRAQEVKADYQPVTDQEKKNHGDEAVVGNKKYRLICDVDHFVKFLDNIPQANKDKLGDSPFKHFLNLKTQNLQLQQVCTTLSLYLDEYLNLQLSTEEMKVTKEDFSALMGITDMGPGSDDNQKMDKSMLEKFCYKNGPEGHLKWEGISMSKVKNILINVKEDEDDIKRAYALMAMYYIVCPPKRTTYSVHMLRHVKDVNGINRQPWASMAIEFLKDGRYNGTLKTKFIGGCVFFLQLYLMRKQDKELDLFKIDNEQIKKFQLKWEVSEPSSALELKACL